MVEARHQRGERGLAGAGRADQRHRLPGRDRQVDAFQSLALGSLVLEADALETDLAARAPDPHGAEIGLGGLVDQAKDALGRGEPLLHVLVDVGHALQRRGEEQHPRDESREVAHRELRHARLLHGEPDDHRDRHRRDELHDRGARRHRRDLLHLVPAQLVGLLVEAALLVVLAAEELHYLVRADRLVDHLGDMPHALLHLVAGMAQPHGELAHHQHDERGHGNREQRQLPVEPQQECQQADDGERVAEHDSERARRGGADLRHVEGELRDEHAGGLTLVVGSGQRQELREHGVAEIGHHARAHPGKPVGGEERAEPAHEEQRDDHRGQPLHQHRVLLDEGALDQRLHQRRQRRRGRGDDHHAENADREDVPVRPHVREQPTVEGAGVHGGQTITNPDPKEKRQRLVGIAVFASNSPQLGDCYRKVY
jgi:hypothetical protein